MTVEMIYYDWTPESMLEVLLPEPDNFLKVRETLTRIGIASRKDKKLYQSCHILHKQGHYFIVHFKELFALDGKQADLSRNDIQRRNTLPAVATGLVGAPGTVIGVTAADVVEATEFPTALVATTVKV
jgi:hypothetical protein